MDNWTAPKYNFMKHTIVLGGSQFTRSIPLSKREAKIKNQAGFFVFDKFTLQVNLGDKSGGVYKTSLLNMPFISVFIHVYDLRKTVLCLCACF